MSEAAPSSAPQQTLCWAMAADGAGEEHELGVIDWAALPARAVDGALDPADLITIQPWRRHRPGAGAMRYRLTACQPLDSLGRSVQRHDEALGIISGQVVAVRGLVLIEAADRVFAVRNMIEVCFDRYDGINKRDFAPLGSGDRGRLVTTAQREPVGLLVAGREHVGFVAPVAEFLGVHRLHLGMFVEPDADFGAAFREFARVPLALEDGLAAMSGELSREPSSPSEPSDLWTRNAA